ncbi:alanine racemase [Jatrophihabitans endophyticus]|uniref:alanine racemase n=1 Tax=Jatrophihabitans endophyticus TaxID=1206085 RepID=UPI0019E28A82|nr:alanine racemase [Jatrophihabitans endophyticus]MBE7189639.1 alanine racemase [Jatrophihabitans endophyticus]
MLRTEAVVDLAAIRGNVATLNASTGADVMAVVKADGYGHGLVPSARAAVAGGATWLGTAIVSEALDLRAAGLDVPLLAWLWTPDETGTVERALTAGVDLSVSNEWQLAAVVTAARAAGRAARVHLKIDTGLSRNGCYVDDWPELVASAAKAQAGGEVEVIGVWSHFAYADEPGHPTIARQVEAFRAALDVAGRAGVEPEVRHLANSAATLTLPEAHFDLVRPGIAVYGLSPVDGDHGLVPAMTLRGAAASVKRVRAGEGVSYGHEYVTPRETTLVLVPLGYADGIPRHAGNAGPVWVGGVRATVSGRVCMDQFVVDVGDLEVAEGDPVVLFGPGRDGEPTAQDWADAAGTIHYEIVTRIGPRVPRTYVGDV